MARPPNVLLITSDQQHWRTLGAVNPEIRTPALDRLGSEGTRFTRAYCPNPTCTPTRSSIITGLYPSRHGAWTLGTNLRASVPTVGAALGRVGYRTGLIGKAHFTGMASTPEFPSLEAPPTLSDLPFWRGFHGPYYGFDHVELARGHADEYLVGQHYACWLEDRGCTNWRDYFQPPVGNNRTQRHRWLIPERFHYGHWIAERTIARLEEHAKADEPFLLWASFLDPHNPYLAPEPWDTLYDPAAVTVPTIVPGEHDRNPPHFRLTQERDPDFSPWEESGFYLHGLHSHLHERSAMAHDIAVYYGMISLLDRQVGAIMNRLDALGLAESTTVIFTSDHGMFFGQHGLMAKGPFHYEDVLRVPFIVRRPGTVPAGRTSDALQSLVDLAPSWLALAGLPAPGMQGVDQSGVWAGRQPAVRDRVLVENRHELTTIRLRTLVTATHKITAYHHRPEGELFDLMNDPGEVHNLWDDPAAASTKARMLKDLADTGPEPETMPMPRIAVA